MRRKATAEKRKQKVKERVRADLVEAYLSALHATLHFLHRGYDVVREPSTTDLLQQNWGASLEQR
jgi:hypothetical protein